MRHFPLPQDDPVYKKTILYLNWRVTNIVLGKGCLSPSMRQVVAKLQSAQYGLILR